ncbi:hypothetical protein M422DRAFT_238208 [Sphaerobolus stellatus SS14]|nr:hypothetical protein M422DRAFT_238208 [Sphaerobolus stellatus SS14]
MSPTNNDAHRDDRPSPPRSALDKRDLPPPQQHSRPPPRPVNRSFDLEPNPFEQSFSSTRTDSADRKNDENDQNGDDSKSKQDGDPKPVLPSLAALSSPSDGYSWSDLAGSLRSGPLSPAMLQGPQQPHQPALNPYDPTRNFGRTGLTPSTGLTPLVGGPVSFPPPSPNTAAFLAMVTNNSSAPQLQSNPATITPNTLSAITGMLNPAQASQSTGSIAPSATTSSSTSAGINATAPQHNMHIPGSYQYGTNGYASGSAAAAANTAANGLFLLSQAHQELTKREEAQARADANAGSRRGSKRKSVEVAPQPPTSTTRSNNKRPRANSQRGSKRGKISGDDDDDDDSDDDMSRGSAEPERTSSGGPKKPETEEEKRRNFLERNRQAALKCRQRKKAWLAQLQAKVEFLSNENERLTTALVSSREEISRLNALLGGAGAPQGGVPQVNTQPVSVAVTLPSGGKNVSAQAPVGVVSNGRGYGY